MPWTQRDERVTREALKDLETRVAALEKAVQPEETKADDQPQSGNDNA